MGWPLRALMTLPLMNPPYPIAIRCGELVLGDCVRAVQGVRGSLNELRGASTGPSLPMTVRSSCQGVFGIQASEPGLPSSRRVVRWWGGMVLFGLPAACPRQLLSQRLLGSAEEMPTGRPRASPQKILKARPWPS